MKKYILALAALAFVATSCVEDEPYVVAPIIGTPSYGSGAIGEGQDAIITAAITSVEELSSVKLFYKLDEGDYTSENMTKSTGNTYTGTIPGQAGGVLVTFYVEAVNSKGATKSAERSYTVGSEPIDYTVIRLNEVDTNGKWIEILNTSANAVDISGMRIYKNNAGYLSGDGGEFPTGTTIPGNYYGVINCGGNSTIPAAGGGDIYILIGSSSTGLSGGRSLLLELRDPDGNTVDAFANTNTASPTATGTIWDDAGNIGHTIVSPQVMGRIPDGTGGWSVLGTPTGGSANAAKIAPPVDLPNQIAL